MISSTEDFSKPKAKAFTHDLDLVQSRCVEFYHGHMNDNNVWVLIKLTNQRSAIKRVHGVHVALDSSRTVMESLAFQRKLVTSRGPLDLFPHPTVLAHNISEGSFPECEPHLDISQLMRERQMKSWLLLSSLWALFF